ncbi:MAG: DEAD/DEAH box helicase [Dehalococcoidia bacterium]|nr:DEAD/DEAH box helicase [Dehalococcoidia bacterium]
MSFDSFKFHPRIADGVKRLGYEMPTPIQERAIGPVLEGKDLMGLAETGTGKTAAFVLPISQNLLDGPRGHVRALVLAPTRELAQQTHEVLTVVGKDTKLRSATVYGGVGYEPQIKKLQSGVEFVVACPGRLLDLVERGNVDLSRVEVVVLDEADRMLDMGFLPDIRRILKLLPRERQTLLFTATMPADIERLARDFMRSPVIIQVGRQGPVQGVTHSLYPVASHLKGALLVELLRRQETGPVLVFTRTKHAAARLSERLQRNGFRAACLQGDMSQGRRQAAMDAFRQGRIDILVATDIAARGIDVPDISHVVNYDMPDTVDAYTHRVGRTARANRSGKAINIATRDDVDLISGVERLLNTRLECLKVDGFDYDAPMIRESASRPSVQRPARAGQADSRLPGPRQSAERPGGQRPGSDRRRPRGRAGAPAVAR